MNVKLPSWVAPAICPALSNHMRSAAVLPDVAAPNTTAVGPDGASEAEVGQVSLKSTFKRGVPVELPPSSHSLSSIPSRRQARQCRKVTRVSLCHHQQAIRHLSCLGRLPLAQGRLCRLRVCADRCVKANRACVGVRVCTRAGVLWFTSSG